MLVYDNLGFITQVAFFSGGGGGSVQATETADQVAQAQINQQLWGYYQDNYRPLIDKWAQQKTDPSIQDEEFKRVQGQITGEMAKNIDPSKVTANPVQNTKMLNNLASTTTGAAVQGEGGVRSKQLKDVQNVIDVGRGQATEAVAGIGDIASQSVSAELSDLQLQQQKQTSVENAYGSVAGAVAAGVLNKYGGTKSPVGDTTAQQRTLNYVPNYTDGVF